MDTRLFHYSWFMPFLETEHNLWEILLGHSLDGLVDREMEKFSYGTIKYFNPELLPALNVIGFIFYKYY